MFVPTYLEGGNGVDNGDQEILTETMREYIDYADNARYCRGVIGSGNKNSIINTAWLPNNMLNSSRFHSSWFELRGTTQDIARIYDVLRKIN